MSTFLLIIVLVLGVALAITYFLKRRLEKTMAAAQKQAADAQKERDVEIARARGDTEAAVEGLAKAHPAHAIMPRWLMNRRSAS